MSSFAMSIQPARELFTLNVIPEMFRDELPNVGSFVKVNFEQKEIKIADEYAKVIIGQKQPIQANLFEPSYFVSVSPASAFGGLIKKKLCYIEILDDSTEAHYDLVFGDFRFDSAHFIHDEARDILLVAFPLEETQSAERAREFVTASVLHLVQTMTIVIEG